MDISIPLLFSISISFCAVLVIFSFEVPHIENANSFGNSFTIPIVAGFGIFILAFVTMTALDKLYSFP